MKKTTLALLLAVVTFGSAHAQTCQPGIIAASTPTSRFADQGDGTVADSATKLIWKKCSEGQSWNAATGGCDGIAASYSWWLALQQATAGNVTGFAGRNDWRLPNIKELSSIVERQCNDPTINQGIFPSTPSTWFWSASLFTGHSATAWSIRFSDGTDGASLKSDALSVRLVRGGL